MTLSIQRGLAFARYVKSICISNGDPLGALAFAEARNWHDTPAVVAQLKAATTAFSTGDAVSATGPIAIDFAEYLRPMTLLGRMSGLQRVPFNTRLLRGTSGGAASWVGEGAPIPTTEPILQSGTTLQWTKVASIAVLSNELVRTSNPGAEAVIARDVGLAVAEKMDRSLVDPAFGGTAGVSPASLTYGATAISSTGSTVAAVDGDLKQLLAVLTDANMSLLTAVWIMNPRTATHLSLLRGTSGAPAFPGMTARGGTLLGLPVLTSSAITASGSPGEYYIALIQADEQMVADDGGATLERTDEASLQFNDAPAAGATQLVSLFQHDLSAVMATRFVNWQPRRPNAAAVLVNVTY